MGRGDFSIVICHIIWEPKPMGPEETTSLHNLSRGLSSQLSLPFQTIACHPTIIRSSIFFLKIHFSLLSAVAFLHGKKIASRADGDQMLFLFAHPRGHTSGILSQHGTSSCCKAKPPPELSSAEGWKTQHTHPAHVSPSAFLLNMEAWPRKSHRES